MGVGPLSTMTTGLSGPVAAFGGLMLLGLSPVIRGGNRHVALILLEWLALFVLTALLLHGPDRTHQSEGAKRLSDRLTALAIGALALSPVWLAMVQLSPLPVAWWNALPGHSLYAESLRVAQAPEVAYRALSLTPDFTVLSLLAGLPLSAAFLLAYRIPTPRLRLLMHALVVLADAQAVLGLIQLGPFPGLYFGAADGGRAIGTFANPNHFANYIAMTVPLTVLFLRQAAVSTTEAGERQGRQPLAVVLGIVLFLLLAAILASRSRGGTITGLSVTLLAVWALGPRHRHSRTHYRERRWSMVGLVALLALVAIAMGVDALLARFEGDKTGYFAGDRWQMVVSAWHGALNFWPFGSGMGTFAAVYPAFHPAGLRGFVEHAHNDYVQLLMEAGLLAVVLSLVVLVLIIRQFAALMHQARRAGLGSHALFQAACGLGLLAVLLHSWVDFNLRIPANAILAAFLLGAFLRPLDKPASWQREEMDAS